jgi:hypothetical protein
MLETLEIKSIREAHSVIEKFSETKSTTVVRKIPVMKVGQAARQGDVYITAISEIPSGYKKVSVGTEYQLVEGNTQGSRHVVSDTSGMKVYENKSSELLGPVLEAKNRFTITHPEHAHFEMQPGLYQVTFQADWAEQERRVRD